MNANMSLIIVHGIRYVIIQSVLLSVYAKTDLNQLKTINV